MKYEVEQIEKLLSLIEKENDLMTLCSKMDMKPLEVMGMVFYLKSQDKNIAIKKSQGNIYMKYLGDMVHDEDNTYKFETNEFNEFKFIAISDTRLGSKSGQLSILNDIYEKGKEMGYNNVILCGNISAGSYPMESPYADTNFADDCQSQIDYIVSHFPQVEGMKTYFITGKSDAKHLKAEKTNIGKRIANKRKDMIYLGDSSCNVKIDNATMDILACQLGKTYTTSYRVQQQVDAYRSEDKPDILLYGGLLQMEKFNYRNVNCISVPSVVATTKEMSDKRYSNTVGAWYVTVKTDSKRKLDTVNAINSPYYITNKDDYKTAKPLAEKEKKVATLVPPTIIVKNLDQKERFDQNYVNKMYRYMRNGMPIDDFMHKFEINEEKLHGLLELCEIYDKPVDIVMQNGKAVFKKSYVRTSNGSKLSFDDPNLFHKEICVVSDTHIGNIHQQMHLTNEVYLEAYNRGIDTFLHVGDIVDGNYTNRPESPRQQFLHGFDEQLGYVADMYPEIEGATTYYILGSHDETHYKNDQATANVWLSRCRKDMVYLGQDTGKLEINSCKIVLDHPGGGSAQALSYKPQKRIELLESHHKPNILLIGHYHKSYAFTYRNVQCVQIPALCDTTQFQQKQGLSNHMGAYFLDIWMDKNGNIQYFEPEEIRFGQNDIWDETGKDKRKVKKLKISA